MIVFRQHILPLFLALGIGWAVLKLATAITAKSPQNVHVKTSGSAAHFFANLGNDPKKFIDLSSSLDNKQGITFLGSSELTTESPAIPYRFYNDQTPFTLKAFGHAYFQSFAMHCELMAMRDHLKDAQICVVVSPGWFEKDGMNIEAFLEFVRPEMLANIIWDEHISLEEKKRIGSFLLAHEADIAGYAQEIEYLKVLANDQPQWMKEDRLVALKRSIKRWVYPNNGSKIDLEVMHAYEAPNWEKLIATCQTEFKTKANSTYWMDAKILNDISKGKNTVQSVAYAPVALEKNREWQDFVALLHFLKKEQVKATFVVQGIHPYAYSNLERFQPFLNGIQKECAKAGFPVLNLFKNSKANYEPGLLNDYMHMGDYGWMKVNEFMWKQYYEK